MTHISPLEEIHHRAMYVARPLLEMATKDKLNQVETNTGGQQVVTRNIRRLTFARIWTSTWPKGHRQGTTISLSSINGIRLELMDSLGHRQRCLPPPQRLQSLAASAAPPTHSNNDLAASYADFFFAAFAFCDLAVPFSASCATIATDGLRVMDLIESFNQPTTLFFSSAVSKNE